jgi:chemotaxis protein CheX
VKTLNDVLMNEVLERHARRSEIKGQYAREDNLETKQDQRDSLLRCLIESTESVFSTMCNWPMYCGDLSSNEGFASRHDVSGIIGLSGTLKATIAVSLEQDLVFSAAEHILGTRPQKIDADVVDLVGELANMIGGNAKERLGMHGVSLGLPTVVAGAGHYVAYGSNMAISLLPFHGEHGSLSIELGLA